MAQQINLVLPSPPSTNGLWVNVAGKGRARSKAYRSWRTEAGWSVRQQMVGLSAIACRFAIYITVPDTGRDLDNFIKSTLDLCQSMGAVANDGNAAIIHVRFEERESMHVSIIAMPALNNIRPAPKPKALRQARITAGAGSAA